MKINVEQTVKIVLELSVEEAMWLKAVVQNPICVDECQGDADMRRYFWEALQGVPRG